MVRGERSQENEADKDKAGQGQPGVNELSSLEKPVGGFPLFHEQREQSRIGRHPIAGADKRKITLAQVDAILDVGTLIRLGNDGVGLSAIDHAAVQKNQGAEREEEDEKEIASPGYHKCVIVPQANGGRPILQIGGGPVAANKPVGRGGG